MDDIKSIFCKGLLREDTFVNEDFKYAVVNNMREYLEFDEKDKKEILQKMHEAMEEVDEKGKVKKLINEEGKKVK